MDFDPRTAPPSYFDKQIAKLTARVTTLKAEISEAEAELAWFQRGKELFGTNGGSAPVTEPETRAEETRVTEILPPLEVFANGTKPTVRQAVIHVMRESGQAEIRAADVITRMRHHDWMPTGNNSENIVRNKMREAAKRGDIVKTGYGTYALGEAAQRSELTPEAVGE